MSVQYNRSATICLLCLRGFATKVARYFFPAEASYKKRNDKAENACKCR